MFRSVVLAATAVVLNLLSVGAAYGLLVLVFQHGVGADLLGLQQVERVEAWVPIFLFSVLFALSMDYHVFLLSRIRERYAETGDTDQAVVHGIAATGRIITGAALIIVVVFAGFAAGQLVMFQQMGFGVGVALLVDATLIRMVVVPAAMALLGRWNWYLPAWLELAARAARRGRLRPPTPAERAPARPGPGARSHRRSGPAPVPGADDRDPHPPAPAPTDAAGCSGFGRSPFPLPVSPAPGWRPRRLRWRRLVGGRCRAGARSWTGPGQPRSSRPASMGPGNCRGHGPRPRRGAGPSTTAPPCRPRPDGRGHRLRPRARPGARAAPPRGAPLEVAARDAGHVGVGWTATTLGASTSRRVHDLRHVRRAGLLRGVGAAPAASAALTAAPLRSRRPRGAVTVMRPSLSRLGVPQPFLAPGPLAFWARGGAYSW